MKKVDIDVWEGHIILHCKMWYLYSRVDFIDGLRRIWAVRCGLTEEHVQGKHVLPVIANTMYGILIKCGRDPMHLNELMLGNLNNPLSKYEASLPPVERVILFYRELIMNQRVKDRGNNVPDIPLPLEGVFFMRLIIAGHLKNNYKLYELIKSKDGEREAV